MIWVHLASSQTERRFQFLFFSESMKNYNSLEKSYTVLFQVYAVGYTVVGPFPTGFRLKWLL